nr:transglycosylase SLT domain-containing protein [uncultured Porphyromonas sp.]
MMRTIYLLGLLLSLLLSACSQEEGDESAQHFRGWQEVVDSDTLRIGTLTSPEDFYLLRGEMMGLEYQKAVDFAQAHELVLDVQIERSLDSLLWRLEQGEIDLCITPLAMSRGNLERFSFGGIIDTASLVLVQRKAKEGMISNLSELGGKKVWIDAGGAAEVRLHQIEEEIGENIEVVPSDSLSMEELLVQMGTEEGIDFLLVDEHLGQLGMRYFPSLNADLRVSAPIKYGWALCKENNSLKKQLDTYFLTDEKLGHYSRLRDQNSHLQSYIQEFAMVTERVQLTQGVISQYDALFEKEGARLPWHWTVLAAIAYHESRFRSDVVGWSGARGLMGIMPRTGASYGATKEELLRPEVSIRVAVDCLLEVRKSFGDMTDEATQLSFTLAAYNAGLGHVQDAMRLARKHHAPDSIWQGGVREYILLKSHPEYYNDPVVRFGYLRGKETANYVDDVMNRSQVYHALLQKKNSNHKK